jgi:hypothetical protein
MMAVLKVKSIKIIELLNDWTPRLARRGFESNDQGVDYWKSMSVKRRTVE